MALFSRKTKTEDKKVVAAEVKKETAAPSMKDLYSEEAEKPSVKSKKTPDGKKKESKFNDAYRILVKPLITEKATNLSAVNKYVFIVNKQVNKIEIARAVESIYSVKVLGVNLINVKGKRVTRGRVSGRRKDFKKAIVTLAKGETIKLYEGV